MSARLKKLLKRETEMQPSPCLSIVVPAAGISSRMDGLNKIFAELDGVPVIVHTLIALERTEAVKEIVVVARDQEMPLICSLCREFEIGKVAKIVRGGERRIDSVQSGVVEVSDSANLIGIHDGARPLVLTGTIEKTIECALKCGAAAPAVPIKDTLKRVSNGTVVETPPRNEYYAVQTPQIFDSEIIKAALINAIENDIDLTDDCQAVEAMGVTVHLIEGSYDNIKITTPSDLAVAEAFLIRRADI